MHPIVTASELRDAVASGAAIAADVRWYLDGRKGRDAYERGHIPTAIFVDLDAVLAAPPGPHGRHPLPSPDAFAAAMGGLGIGDDDLVVAYDDASGSIAARLWWMLTVTGHRAAVLDGRAWRACSPRLHRERVATRGGRRGRRRRHVAAVRAVDRCPGA